MKLEGAPQGQAVPFRLGDGGAFVGPAAWRTIDGQGHRAPEFLPDEGQPLHIQRVKPDEVGCDRAAGGDEGPEPAADIALKPHRSGGEMRGGPAFLAEAAQGFEPCGAMQVDPGRVGANSVGDANLEGNVTNHGRGRGGPQQGDQEQAVSEHAAKPSSDPGLLKALPDLLAPAPCAPCAGSSRFALAGLAS